MSRIAHKGECNRCHRTTWILFRGSPLRPDKKGVFLCDKCITKPLHSFCPDLFLVGVFMWIIDGYWPSLKETIPVARWFNAKSD